MKRRLKKWGKADYNFTLDWLLRGVNAVTTGEALFTAMKDLTPVQFKAGLESSEKLIDRSLNRIASRIGLDHDRVLGSRFAIPLMTRYESQRGGKLDDQSERDRILYWYIHTLLWGRYSASTESVLNKDLEAIEPANASGENGALGRLIEKLRENRGNPRLDESDFSGSTKGNRFYPLLYMMTRACHARDWGTGDELNNHLLGHLTRLDIHHVFPKALLYDAGFNKRDVNAIANFTFLTQETNLEVSKRNPTEYFPCYEGKNPGAIATHWIPMDPKLWKVENYFDFLSERRKLLAVAANEFLEKLAKGNVPDPDALQQSDFISQGTAYIPGNTDNDEEEIRLVRCRNWVASKGLPDGQMEYELTDESGNQFAFLDLAWPEGLQPGLTQPVAILIDESSEVNDAASSAGFRCFSSTNAFRKYVAVDILGEKYFDDDSTEALG